MSEHVQIVPNLHVSILETKTKLQYYQESSHYLIMQLNGNNEINYIIISVIL